MFSCPIGSDLDLRLIEERHVDAVHACVRRNLEHLSPWMPWATDAYDLDGCRAWQRAALEQFARNQGFTAGIFDRGQFVGAIGHHAIRWDNRSTSLGYWLDAAAQGRGIMTAACRAVVDYSIAELRLNRVEIRCGLGNARSRAVPLRLGFREEGVARQSEKVGERYVDHVVYAMLAGEWTAREVTAGV